MGSSLDASRSTREMHLYFEVYERRYVGAMTLERTLAHQISYKHDGDPYYKGQITA